ncbi:MAG: MFS transporter [Thermoleophilia bacterium]|nr:MFS transporter [Thermoleophilia bacterium]
MHLRWMDRAGLRLPGWAVWGLAAGFYLTALFHRNALGVAALDAQARLGITAGQLAVLSSLQLALYLAMQVPAGLAADRWGPRRTLALGLLLMGAGEVAFAAATTLPAAAAGRGLIGIGDACIFLNVLRLAHSWFPAGRYALLTGIAGLAGAVGQLLTTVPLGTGLDAVGWTPTFLATGTVTLAMAAACVLLVRDAPAGVPPRPASPEPVRTALRMAAATPATRHGFWVHMGLMGPFVTVTALWGHPFLVRAQGMAPGPARASLLATVAAFAGATVLLGVLGTRPALLRAHAVTLSLAWTAVLAWPGTVPAALMLGTLLVTGAGGAAGLLGFDIARAGNAPARAGAASGLVNLGGFSAAVTANLVIGQVASATGDLGAAMWPVALVPAIAAAALAVRRPSPAAAACAA